MTTDQVSPTYNLSPLSEAGTGWPEAAKAGAWFRAPARLSELAARLEAPPGGRVQDAKSVPDAWAQPRTFAAALLQNGHPLADAAVRQWRALMALFALESVRKLSYRISLKPVDLRRDGPRLDKVLLALLPANRIPQGGLEHSQHAAWSSPWLISLETARSAGASRLSYDPARVIGMMNPACLVSPGRDCGRTPIPGVPWMSGEDWADPLKLTDQPLSNDERKVLQTYLDTIRDGLIRAAGGQGDDEFASLIRRLDEFAADCDGADQCQFTADVSAPAGDEGAPQIYRLLRTGVTLVEDQTRDPGEASACRVELRADLGMMAPFKGVILIDRSIETTVGDAARNILAWRTRSLAALCDNDAEFAEARRQAAEAGYLMIRPDSLFTDRLVALDPDTEPCIEGHPMAFRGALMPFSPLVLLMLRPEQLINAVDLKDEGAKRRAVTLKLMLAGPIGPDGARAAPREHELRKTFAESPSDRQGELVSDATWIYGATAVWPDIQSDQWKWYFARLTYNLRQLTAVRGRFAESGRQLAAQLTEPGLNAQQRLQAALEFGSSVPITGEAGPFAGHSFSAEWLKRSRRVEAESPEEIETSPYPFEAIFFCYAEDSSPAAAPAGLALLRTRPVNVGLKSSLVAVDFGTTNSVACLEDGAPVVFRDRLLHPITSPNQARLKALLPVWQLAESFLPPVERPTPTPSVMLDRVETTVGATDAPIDAPVHASVIYFQPELDLQEDGSDKDKFRSVLKRAHFNLKWDPQPATRIACNRFIRQLMMMTALEALDRGHHPDMLRWRFSRPDAQNKTNAEFWKVVDEQWKALAPNAGATLSAQMGQAVAPILPLCSEAKAAGNYVMVGGADGGFVAGDVNIVLDIGGGTTDIALWEGDRLIWHGSLQLAGKDFFTRHVIRNPELLRRLGLPAWASIIEGRGAGEAIARDRLAYVGELLFSGPVLERALDAKWLEVSGTPEAQALVHTAEVFLGGLAWYVGLVTKGLLDRGVEGLPRDSLNNTMFALCGRGAGLYRRLHAPGVAGGSRVDRLLRLFSRAAELDGAKIRACPSNTPKLEVAIGMVKQTEHGLSLESDDADAPHDYLPSGLDIPYAGGGVLAAGDDVLDTPQGGAGRPDMASFQRFLDALAAETETRVDIGDDESSGAANIRKVVFSTLRAAETADADIEEPPFITGLRTLLDDMTTPGRHGRVSITTDVAPTRRERRERRPG